MNQKQKIFIVVLIGILIILILMVSLIVKRLTSQTPQQGAARTEQPTSSPQQTYTNLSHTSPYQSFAALDPQKNISQVQIIQLPDKIPNGFTQMPLYAYEEVESTKKYNPSLELSAEIINPNIFVYKNPSGDLSVSFPLETGIQKANFGWITNDLILLMEKSANQTLFYLINPVTKQKTRLGDDSTIPTGVNVDIGPEAFNTQKQSIIVLITNDGQRWELQLSQN